MWDSNLGCERHRFLIILLPPESNEVSEVTKCALNCKSVFYTCITWPLQPVAVNGVIQNQQTKEKYKSKCQITRSSNLKFTCIFLKILNFINNT